MTLCLRFVEECHVVTRPDILFNLVQFGCWVLQMMACIYLIVDIVLFIIIMDIVQSILIPSNA